MEGLRGGPANMQEPESQEGYLLKRRKWPMKGWHKVRPLENSRTVTHLAHRCELCGYVKPPKKVFDC